MFKTSNQLSLALGDTGESNVHALDDVLQFVAGNSRMQMCIRDRFAAAVGAGGIMELMERLCECVEDVLTI